MQHNGLREMVNGCDFDVANFRAAGLLPMKDNEIILIKPNARVGC